MTKVSIKKHFFNVICIGIIEIVFLNPISAGAETSEIIDCKIEIDQFFNGFTENVYKTASWNPEFYDAASLIHSQIELQKYLSEFFEDSVSKQYLNTYSESFFKDNVLAVNTLYQPSGTKPLYTVEEVNSTESSITIKGHWVIPEESEEVESCDLIQIVVSREYAENKSIKWIQGEAASAENPHNTDDNKPNENRSHYIDVKNIMQYPELPTGCESVALTTLLNHLGYSADKVNIVRQYLPKMDFYWSNGILYGADFRTTFAGNPESEYAYGCYAPCIVITANSFLTDHNYNAKAVDVSGTDFDDLLNIYIDNNIPVLIWITSNNLHESQLTDIWTTPEGERVQWRAYEHCVVLTGYDLDNAKIFVADPLLGNTSYNYEIIKQRYIDMGNQAVYIQTKKNTEKRLNVYGDIDGDGNITSSDSLMILRRSISLEYFDETQEQLADIDDDGSITSADALEVLRYSVGLSSNDRIGKAIA